MKKSILGIVFLLIMTFSMSAQAAEIQAIRSRPSISFSGTTATCSVDCKSGNSKDEISATLTLWRGNTLVDSWSDSGMGRVIISEQCAVKKGQSYKLTLSYSVNGQAQSSVSVTGKCP
ncbi:MAG: hypothetical protein ACK5H4_13535 [Lacrimispora sphenoides]